MDFSGWLGSSLSSLFPAGFPPVPQYPLHTAIVITTLTEPCLRYSRTRLLNNTLHSEVTIGSPKYALEAAGIVVAADQTSQNSSSLAFLDDPAI